MSAIHFQVITTAKDAASQRVRRKFEGKVLIVVLVAVFTFAAMPCTSFAAKFEAQLVKTLTWQFEAEKEQLELGMCGTYKLHCRSDAKCDAHRDPDRPEDKTGYWSFTDDFSEVSHLASSTVPHANAKGRASISAKKAEKIGEKKYRLIVVEKMDIEGNSVPCICDKTDGTSEGRPGHADAVGVCSGVNQVGWELKGKVNGAEMKTQSNKNRARGMVRNPDGGKVVYHDPISISLTEIDTGVVTTEELFSVELEGITEGSTIRFDYDLEAGLMLRTLRNSEGIIDGSFTISGTTSDWLVNPFGEFGAYLGGGVFAATGVWAGLPWVLTYEGEEVTEAFLAADYLPSNFDYVVPDSLINDSYEYEQALSVGSMLEGECYRTIPEPMTLLLLGCGSLVLLRRRRA